MTKVLSDCVQYYLRELSSRVVFESGTASDSSHVGKILFRSFQDAPDIILQIDGATGEKETLKSTFERSIRCAISLKNIDLKYQDVIAIIGSNHLDLTIPLYAAIYTGLIVAGIDINLGAHELRDTLKCITPKIIFCQNSKVDTLKEALKLLNISPKIVTFGEKEGHVAFTQFLDNNSNSTNVDLFKPTDFDPVEAILLLTATSGSTGLPKFVSLTHENLIIGFPYFLYGCTTFPCPFTNGLVISPMQWISATFQFIMSPIVIYTRIQTSATVTPEHVNYLIKKYKPQFVIVSPTFMTSLLKQCEIEKSDLTSLKHIVIGGSNVSEKLLNDINKLAPKSFVQVGYGMTEISGLFTMTVHSPRNSVGKPFGHLQFKIINLETNDIINEPNMLGELFLKGRSLFKGYYNDSEITKTAFDEDGWFKTGDIVYRDEQYNFYFADRCKLLLKYKSHQISPVELETVINKHPGVRDVAVIGIPDEESGDLPVAVVITRDGFTVSAQDIKDLIKRSLAETKQLRGGVIFVKEFPTTSTSKIDRKKLKELAIRTKKE